MSCEHDWAFLGGLDRPDPRASRLDCEKPQVLACRVCGDTVVIRCMSSRSKKCTPCAARYRGRVGQVAGSGIRVSADRAFFITLTAPGTVPHRLPGGRWCPCTPPGGVKLSLWNPTAARRFNRFMTELRRRLGPAEYFRGTELQRRNAIHHHILLRGPQSVSVTLIRKLAIRFGFGHSVDVQALRPEHAGYVAKYVSKAADDRRDVPWDGVKLLQVVDQNGVVRRVPRRSWKPTYRTWSGSRNWGRSMAWVLAAQQHHTLTLEELVAWGGGVSLGPSWAERVPRRPFAPPSSPIVESDPSVDDRVGLFVDGAGL